MSVTTEFYITGGTLQQDASCYVERQADTDLYDALHRGDYCYVLTARQMGKSSLMVHTAARLRQEGIAVVLLDLQAVGQNLSVEQWYDGLLNLVGQQLDLEDALEGFWQEHPRLGPLQRWMAALRQVVLERLPGRVVLFVDEIDAVRTLPFSADEFFAGIRECYNRRTQDPDYARLTFCLLGVASPSDLISDTRLSPFNIGRRIELADFTEAEAAPLAAGLHYPSPCPLPETERGSLPSETEDGPRLVQEQTPSPFRGGGRGRGNAAELLQRILYWTGGHPYLTQRLCRAVAEHTSQSGTDLRALSTHAVDDLCAALFFTRQAREADDNLVFVRNRLLKGEVDLAALLDLYQQVRRGRRVADDETNPLATLLRLSGVCRAERGALRVRNRIYERVFDPEWVIAHMPDAELRRQRAAYRRGLLRATGAAGLIVAVMAALAFSAVRSGARARRLAEGRRQALALVASERDRAVRAERREREQRLTAQEAQRLASASAQKARASAQAERKAARRAEAQQRLAVDSAEQAHRQERLARIAETGERAERRRAARLLYIADMRLAARAWEAGEAPAVSQLLEAHLPRPGEEDLRGFDWRYQWKLLHRGAVTYPGHQGGVRLGALAPDGHLVTLDGELQLRHWDRTGRRVLRSLRLLSVPRSAVLALSPDGSTLAVGISAGPIRLLDMTSGRERGRLPGHPGGISSLAFSGNSRLLASCGWFDRTLRLWDLPSRRETHRVRSLTTTASYTEPFRLALSPDGRMLALANLQLNGWVAIYDLTRGSVHADSLVAMLPGERGGTIQAVAYSPDGRTLATGAGAGEVFLWDPSTGKEIRRLDARSDVVIRLAFSPDSRTLAIGGDDARVGLWEVGGPTGPAGQTQNGGRQVVGDLGGPTRSLSGHTGSIRFLAFSPDGTRLATGSDDNTARRWDLAAPTGTRSLMGHPDLVSDIAYSPDGRWLATTSWDGTAILWEARTGRLMHTDRAHTRFLQAVAFSPDSRTLATGHGGGVKLWDLARQREQRQLTGLPATYRPPYGRDVRSIAFSPDGKVLAAGFGRMDWFDLDYDAVVRLWDVTTGRVLANLPGHRNTVSAVAFSPDGRLLVTASLDHTVKLWRVGTWREIRTFAGFDGPVLVAAFSPNGDLLAMGGEGIVRLWDVVAGREVKPLRLATTSMSTLAFSPDGKMLATGSPDRTVRLWDVVSGRETRTLGTQKTNIYALAFSPDGNTLASGDGPMVRLWEAASPAEVARTLAAERGAQLPPRAQSPEPRAQSGAEGALGHRRAAEACLQKQQWAEAVVHLDRLIRADAAGPMDRIARGRALARLNRKGEAMAELVRAVAGGSHDPEVWIERGSLYAEWRQWERAAADFTRAIDRSGRDGMAWYRRAMVGLGQGETEATRRIRDRLLARVSARNPDDPEPWVERGNLHYAQGKWQQAAVDYRRALALGSQDWEAWHHHAIACLGSGDAEAYRRSCSRLLTRFGRTEHPGVALFVAWVCALAPGAVADLSQPIELVRKAREMYPKFWGNHHALALTLYRSGQYDTALRVVTGAMASVVGGDSGANRLLLALIHHRLGHADEARRWREKGIQLPGHADSSREYLLMYQLLRREADTLIGGNRR